MAKSGKKNKKGVKKGKSQEDTPAPQPEVPSTEPEQQQLAADTPQPEEAPELPTAPTTGEESKPLAASEVTTQVVPEIVPDPESVLESAPEREPEPEQTQNIEQSQTPPDPDIPSQTPLEDNDFTEITKHDTLSNQSPGMIDTQIEHIQEPSHEDLGVWKQLDIAEAEKNHDDAPIEQSNSVDQSEQTPITAPQSPTFTIAPETSTTEPTETWPAWEENDLTKASPAGEETATPKNDAHNSHVFTNPFGEIASTEPASEPAQTSDLAPAPASQPEVELPLESELAKEAEPIQESEPVKEPGPAGEPETVATSEPVEEPEPIQKPETATASEPVREPEPVQEPEVVTAPEPVEEPEPVQVPEAVTASESAIEPEPLAAVEPAMGAEHTMEPAQEVTPPASKPQSPAPATASPSYKSASPMQRAVSPAAISVADTVDAPHTFPPPPAAPTPPPASPKTQDVPPLKDASYPTPRAAPPTPPSASPQYNSSYPTDQAYSPRQKSSPLHNTRKPSSPNPRVSSPLAHAYTSPVMSPHTTSVPPMPPSFPPSVSHSYATAYQSPTMSSAGYFPPQYGYYQPTSHPHHTPRGPMAPNGSYPGMRDPGYPNEHDRSGRGGPMIPSDQEDARELLDRIQDAIPDINRLLGSYKHTKTKLQSREAEFKQMESQHKQALMHKDFFIEALQNQLRKTANESAEEATKLKNMINELRMELGNMEEKRKDMEEKLADSEASISSLEEKKAGLEEQIKKLNEQIEEERVAHRQELEKQRAEMEAEKEEALKTQKQELTELFEEIKAEDEKAAAEALAVREAELLEQQEAMKTEYEQQKQQMQDSHDTLQAEFDTKLAELATTQGDLEKKHQELEDTRHAHVEQVESLENKHQEKITEMERAWNEEKTGLETQLSEKSEELANSERENKRLEEDLLSKEKQLQLSVDNMRLTINNLDNDCDRLRKTLHSLGEATDLKNTKGDTFFLDCFGQLQRLIVTLSKEHFSYLPIDPPQEVLSKLPPELPSFLDNTPASRELRSAYVQHVVSKILTYRIFHPFLFTLGRRYDKADILFQMLSMDIRRKSVRREAFWRQQTLKAAYTTSDAKESINVVAAVIVDEISNSLKHFADPRRMDGLLTSIRKIVKLAAETWRHARVERELIIAALPAPEDGSVPGEDWEEYGVPKENASGRASPKTADFARHVVLRPFPRIIREAAHEDFVGDEGKASPCTYSRGSVLYSDSPIILARLQELAGKTTDAPVRREDSPPATGRLSRASTYYEPPSPRIPYAQDALIEGATGPNFGTA
ncbi:uncharacterized protein BDW70DRAFT_83708 [Aspergillus foveolatus]|uniref:uncharacterized protein n=1 Tax=Aspergillus foveolatus TaxID=210207 RepID=UPI003CCD800C